MSVILDALKKLDREKASRRQWTANIAAEILSPDLPRPLKRTQLYLTIVVLTALVTAALTYTVVKSYFASKPSSSVALNSPAKIEESSPGPRYSSPSEFTKVTPSPASGKTESRPSPKTDLQTKPSPPPPVSPSVVSPSVVTPPAPSQTLAPATASPGPAQAAREEINPVPARIEPPVESKPVPSSPAEKETGQNGIIERTNMAPGNTERPVQRSPITPDPSTLRVSAIVWHEEPSKRIAVINGMIMTEQSLIEGAKVVEISPNRVRLSHNGRAFEILLK